jgi:hypothetical protein
VTEAAYLRNVAVASAGAAVVVAILSLALVARDVPSDFYAAAAQVLPVLLIALVVEQRLIARLSATEERYVATAEELHGLAVRARQEHEDMRDDVAERLARRLDANPEFEWVWEHAEASYSGSIEDIAPIAANRYRAIRRAEAMDVGLGIAIVLAGETAALIGVLCDGSSGASALLGLTAGALAGALLLVVLGAAREVLGALQR